MAMKKWQEPEIFDLGVEETKSCTKEGHPHTKDKKSDSSDSSKDGDSSCSSDCPFDRES